MALVYPTFADYTYKVSYKISADSPEIVLSQETRIITATTTVIQGGAVTTVPHPTYDYFMSTIVANVEPVEGSIIKIVRNKLVVTDDVTGDKTDYATEEIIYESAFEFLNYEYRKSLLLSHAPYGGGATKRILFQLLNKNETEKLPSIYEMDSLNFSTNTSVPQYVDLYFREKGTEEWITLGTDLEVSTTGQMDNIPLPELPEDTAYEIKVFHYETNEEQIFDFTTNLTPTLGPNPIIDRYEWNGRIMMFTVPGVKSGMNPKRTDVDWMFGLDFSTKSFDNIASSMWSSEGEEFNFVFRSSASNGDDTYIGSSITPSKYLSLPHDYSTPNLEDGGASQNLLFGTFFKTNTDANERRTLFCKFYLESDHNGPVKLFNYSTVSSEQYIGLLVDGTTVTFRCFGTSYALPSGQTIEKEKWYTMVLVIDGFNIKYVSITNADNYTNATLPIGGGIVVGNVDDKTRLLSAGKQDVTVQLTYDASTVDQTNMGIAIEYAIYQYEENNNVNQLVVRTHTLEQAVTSGSGKTMTFTIPNDAGYGIALGYSVRFMYGGVTSNGTVTVTDIKLNGASVKTAALTGANVAIDPEVTTHMSYSNGTVSYLATGSTIGDPIAGILIQNALVPNTPSPTARTYIGGGLVTAVKYVVAKIGFKSTVITGTDSWANPYKYLPSSVFKLLNEGYKMMPKLRITNLDSQDIVTIGSEGMVELKDSTVNYYLEGMEAGPSLMEVVVNGGVLASKEITVKTLKMAVEDARYDINFEEDFDSAISEFKRRYYAKQKRWGGNMGGGTHGNLIYFNRGEAALILEQHGDLYKGKVPSVQPAGAEGYGLPTDIIELPSSFPSLTDQRCARVGGLIQSVDYHAYGMFDCWFNVPKGMAGLAICLWYFHYQEVYSYDRTFKFWTEEGWNGYNYMDSVVSGYGATWLVVNNEIDMELGSENTPYRTNVNPNNDASISWYVNGLSYRQMIGCTDPDPALYGTWIIDWEASSPAISAVTETDPTKQAAYLWTNQLVWVKVNSKLDETNYGANTRSCRFNNWVNERWNDGTGVYGTYDKSPLGKRELSVNNRTPLGDINPKALQEAQRYVEKYYDDGLYHKWSIDWTKDYTRLLIDDVEIAILKAFVPFNPMTMLVGCWFPSANIYDKSAILGEYGTWSGVNANWTTAQMKVKRIKFEPYTEAEVSTEQMRYDCETYAQDGLREFVDTVEQEFIVTPAEAILTVNNRTFAGNKVAKLVVGRSYNCSVTLAGYVTQTFTVEATTNPEVINVELLEDETVDPGEGGGGTPSVFTVTIVPTPSDATVMLNSIQRLSVTVNHGENVEYSVSKAGYTTQAGTIMNVTQSTSVPITLSAVGTIPDPENYALTSMQRDNARVRTKLASMIAESGRENLVIWSFMTDQHINGPSAIAPNYNVTAPMTARLNELVDIAEEFQFSALLFGGDIIGYGENNSASTTAITPGNVPATNTQALANMQEAYDIVNNVLQRATMPVLMTAGNHDTEGGGAQWGAYIPMSTVYNNMIAPYASKLTYVDPAGNSTCCYYDDTVNKIRFASIDVLADDNITRWTGEASTKRPAFGNQILSTLPADYKLVIFQHKSMGPNFYGANDSLKLMSYVDPTDGYSSYDKYEEWYDNLKTHANFNRVLIIQHGNSHIDNQSLTKENKFLICSQASAIDTKNVFNGRTSHWDIRTSTEHMEGYITETAFDVLVYNKLNGKLEILRYGAGHDRSFDLNANPATMQYGRITGKLVNAGITDFSTMQVLVSSNTGSGYEKQNKNRYKTLIYIDVKPDGTFDSYASYVSSSDSRKLGIPIGLNVRIKIINKTDDTLRYDTGLLLTTANQTHALGNINVV